MSLLGYIPITLSHFIFILFFKFYFILFYDYCALIDICSLPLREHGCAWQLLIKKYADDDDDDNDDAIAL